MPIPFWAVFCPSSWATGLCEDLIKQNKGESRYSTNKKFQLQSARCEAVMRMTPSKAREELVVLSTPAPGPSSLHMQIAPIDSTAPTTPISVSPAQFNGCHRFGWIRPKPTIYFHIMYPRKGSLQRLQNT
ncbi:hypothetical protein J6590_004353 [Homalodisca vitripennis]|nr:hypothetical protein J6590_004353 [Homalodisca vitripennis]